MRHFGKLFGATAIAATVLASCGGNAEINKKVKLNNDIDSASFAFGQLVGTQVENTLANIKEQLGTDLNLNDFLAGFKAAIDKDSANLKFNSPQEANMFFSSVMQSIEKRKADENLLKSQQFLDDNAKKEGVVTLPNGVQYIVLNEGNGAKPEPQDTVECHYVGTLIDGTEFDSSIKRGEPAKFPLSGVIRGWQETIPMMPLGSKWRIFIPSELAYGPQGRPTIPANSALIFEVELLQIMKGPKPEAK